MSKLHSENYDRNLGLRVRVKLVNLNGSGRPNVQKPSQGRLTSAVAIIGETLGRGAATGTAPANEQEPVTYEICIATGKKITGADFETHIERCKVCSSRVDLQLDFIHNLQLAVYQRKVAPKAEKVHGAMLVSAPQLNFAICGEIEPV